jgi:PAS domain S-box-containing protein
MKKENKSDVSPDGFNSEEKLKITELEFRSLMEQAADGIFISDGIGQYVDVNESGCKMLGYSKEELLRMGVNDIVVREGNGTTSDPLKLDALREGKTVLTTRKLRKKDGTSLLVEINARMLTNGKLMGMVRDLTERKKLEEKEELFGAIVNSSDDAILSKTLDGIITSWNKGAERIFGYTSEEAIGKHISILVVPHLQEEEKGIMEKIKRGEGVEHYETVRVRKDGKIISASLSVSPIKDFEGNIVGASKILRDISEKKRAEENLLAREKQFRETLDSMMEGIQIHNFDWQYTYVNDALVKYSTYKREELIGHTLMEKYPGIEQTPLFKVLERCMTQRVTEHLETEFIFPNGTKAFFELSIQPIPQGIFILSIDITERKKAEEKNIKLHEELEQKVIDRTTELELTIEQLRESEDKFQKAFQASAAGIAITHISSGKYLDVNEAFVELTGYSKEELINHTTTEKGIVRDIKERERILQRVKEHGSARHFEMTIYQKSGRMLEILASIETVLLNGEKYAINIIFDITERKHAEEQLASVNKELEAFSYSVSHDLRAPLRAIDGYAKMLEEDYNSLFDDEGKRLLATIQRNATKMGTLIDDLLAFSKLGKKAVLKTTLNLNDLVKRIVMDFDHITKHKAEIKIGPLHSANGDYTLVSQVLMNLIANAIKYSSKKEHPLIEIYSEEKEGEVIYIIKDNGEGFDMAYADKLFGVFQRLHKEEEFEGTGVGLAIVQRIINKHEGRVWAEATPGEGATFSFTLQ